jgi:hypothetical protein
MRVSLECPPITAEEVVASRRLLRATTAALVLGLGLVGGVALDVGVPLVLEHRAKARALAACVEEALATADAIRRGTVESAEVHRGVDATVIVAGDALVLIEGGTVTATAHRCRAR